MTESEEFFFGVGVASYQQFDGLYKTVQNLIYVREYLKLQNVDIGLFVSDNHSKNFPSNISDLLVANDIRFFTQQQNIGFAGNLKYLLRNISSRYVLVIGCGELVEADAISELIAYLSKAESGSAEILGGTIAASHDQLTPHGRFSLSPDNLAVNPAISLSIWNSRFIDEELLEKEYPNDWPHVELAIAINKRFPHGKYFHYSRKAVTLDQPNDGWHNSSDFLNLILRHDELVKSNPRINLGEELSRNFKAIGSWIYYYRRSNKRHLPLKSLIKVLFRVSSSPKSFAYILVMSIIPKFFIRVVSKFVNFLKVMCSLSPFFRYGKQMSDLNRENSPFLIRISRAVISLIKLASDLVNGNITRKQFLLDLRFRLVSKRKVQNDDFNWEIYPSYYKEELKSISKIHTLIIRDGNFIFENGRLLKKHQGVRNLHPNHEVLYQIIASIKPASVLEVGCGGGDHLANINELLPGTKLIGLDRSEEQIQTLRERHPLLSVETYVLDVTNSDAKQLSAELVYTQAVLMHISETDGRFRKAMDFVFSSAHEIVVMVENWSQHNFLEEVTRIQREQTPWANAFLYSVKSEEDSYASAIIVSKKPLSNFLPLHTYDEVLAGRKIQTH